MNFSCATLLVQMDPPVVMMAMFMSLNSLSSFILPFRLLQVSKIVFLYCNFLSTFIINYYI